LEIQRFPLVKIVFITVTQGDDMVWLVSHEKLFCHPHCKNGLKAGTFHLFALSH